MITKETKGIVRGEYGQTPVPISDEMVKKVIGDEERITCRPADKLEPEIDKLREEIKDYIEQDEDVLSYALFGPVAMKYFEHRKAPKTEEAAAPEAPAAKAAFDVEYIDMDSKDYPIK